MKRLGGLWAADFTPRGGDLCSHRQQDVSMELQVEIWLKHHRVVQLKRLGNSYVFVVEPKGQGFQAVDFLRPNQHRLRLFFATPQGEEIFYINEEEKFQY